MELTDVGRRRVGLIAMLAVTGAFAVSAALAYACTLQPTLSLTEGSATPGSTVSGTGEFFSKTGGPVQLHFNSLDSAVVWSGRPSAIGRIAFAFEVPDVAPGDYTIVATQAALGTGRPVAGTPSRAPLTVVAAPAPVAQAPSGAPAPRVPERDRPRAVPVPPGASPAPESPRTGPASETDRANRAESIGAAPVSAPAFNTPTAKESAAGTGTPGKARSSSTATPGAASAPSERSAAGNVWDGFDAGGESSLVTGDRGSLPASGPGSELGLGLGLLGIGLVGIVGGFLAAAVRRRRKAEQGITPPGSAR